MTTAGLLLLAAASASSPVSFNLHPWHASVHFPTAGRFAAPTAGRFAAALPVVLLVTGFGGEIPAEAYSDLSTAVASRGAVMVGLSRPPPFPMLTDYPAVARSLDPVLQFVVNGSLAARLSEAGASAPPNVSALILGGHSAGCHVAVRRILSSGCGAVGGVLLLDPVDGADPWGLRKEFVISPPNPLRFSTPALHLETGLDPRPVQPLEPACAPRRLSNGRFFDAWGGPIWQANATAFGHMDLANDGEAGAAASFVCPGNKDRRERRSYRHFLATAIAAFARGLVVDGSMAAAAAALNGSASTGIDVLFASRRAGRPQEVRPGCELSSRLTLPPVAQPRRAESQI